MKENLLVLHLKCHCCYTYPLHFAPCLCTGSPLSSVGFCRSYHSKKVRRSEGRQFSATLPSELTNCRWQHSLNFTQGYIVTSFVKFN